MEDPLKSSAALETVRIGSLTSYLNARGYRHREKWGSYLDRYSRKSGSREDNVLVPSTRDIRDFHLIISDLLGTLSSQLKLPAPTILKDVINSGYEIVRIRANEGEASSTLSYDAAIDLLRGGFALIDSSAVIATTAHVLSFVRGRRSDIVRKYLDTVRVGQTEVGSFVLTLLLPADVDDMALELSAPALEGLSLKVAARLSNSLQAAEQAVRAEELKTKRALSEQGLTSNFSGAIARMIAAVGDVTISVAPTSIQNKSTKFVSSKFLHSDLAKVRELERRLTPKGERKSLTVSGTIVELREPTKRGSGTIVLRCNIYGEERPVRLKFTRDERPTVIHALEKKADFELSVSGELINNSGHYNLENADAFHLVRRGTLT